VFYSCGTDAAFIDIKKHKRSLDDYIAYHDYSERIYHLSCYALDKSNRPALVCPVTCLFQYTVFHDDSVSGEIYGFTFTNDDLWQNKMLRDLQKPAVTINETEDE